MPRVIAEEETRKLIDMAQALKAVEQMFRYRAAGKVLSLPRRRLSGRRRQLNVMAAWQADWDLMGLRAYMGGANTITLYNARSGEMILVLNARYLSSLRTGAASGVAAKYLAPSRATVLGLIGTGKQAAFQLEALTRVRPLKRIFVYGRDSKKRKAFIARMARVTSAALEEASSIEQLEETSDIIALATNATAPVLEGTRIKNDALIVTIGANSQARHEVSTNLIGRMDLVVTDDLATARDGSGDLILACQSGALEWEKVVPLESIVSGRGRDLRPKRILFQSNGIADEDLAVARFVLERAGKSKLKLKDIPGL